MDFELALTAASVKAFKELLESFRRVILRGFWFFYEQWLQAMVGLSVLS